MPKKYKRRISKQEISDKEAFALVVFYYSIFLGGLIFIIFKACQKLWE